MRQHGATQDIVENHLLHIGTCDSRVIHLTAVPARPCRQKEEEMMRQHGATQDDIEKHRRMLAEAQNDAEARRAHADEARRHAEGLPGFAPATSFSLNAAFSV